MLALNTDRNMSTGGGNSWRDLFSIATPSLPTRLQFDTAARPAPPTTYRNYAPTPSSLNFLLVASKTRHCDSCGAHHSIITRHLATNTLNIARPLFPAKLAIRRTNPSTWGSSFDEWDRDYSNIAYETIFKSTTARLILFYCGLSTDSYSHSISLTLHGPDTEIIGEFSQRLRCFSYSYAEIMVGDSDGRNAGVIVEPYQATVLTTSPGMPILLQLVRLDDWVPVLWSDDTRYRTREAESMPGFPVCRGTGPSHVHFNVEPSLLCQKPMSVKFYSFESFDELLPSSTTPEPIERLPCVWSSILEPYQVLTRGIAGFAQQHQAGFFNVESSAITSPYVLTRTMLTTYIFSVTFTLESFDFNALCRPDTLPPGPENRYIGKVPTLHSAIQMASSKLPGSYIWSVTLSFHTGSIPLGVSTELYYLVTEALRTQVCNFDSGLLRCKPAVIFANWFSVSPRAPDLKCEITTIITAVPSPAEISAGTFGARNDVHSGKYPRYHFRVIFISRQKDLCT
ncbi:hypothetical protein B0H11DRAFT_2257269 [Mycena galericulata]|nr:hypothetical protein B0H11DRAFT_2257269 [Mycena galericulata]